MDCFVYRAKGGFSYWSFTDDRESQEYNGVSIDLSDLKGMDSESFWNAVDNLINTLLKDKEKDKNKS